MLQAHSIKRDSQLDYQDHSPTTTYPYVSTTSGILAMARPSAGLIGYLATRRLTKTREIISTDDPILSQAGSLFQVICIDGYRAAQ